MVRSGSVSVAIMFVTMLATAACTSKSSPSTPSNGAWRLSGTINTVAGSPIAGARLTVQSGSNEGVRVTTDSFGRYAFPSLESGRFTMLIEALGFISVAPVVDLYKDLQVNFALYSAQ